MSSELPESAEADVAAILRRRQRRRAVLRNVVTAVIVLWPAMLQIEALPKRAETLRVLGPAGPGAGSGGGAGPRTAASKTARNAGAPPGLVRLADLGAFPSIVEAHLPPAEMGTLIGSDAGLIDPLAAGPDGLPLPSLGPGGPFPGLPVFPTTPYISGPGGLPPGGGLPPVSPPSNPALPPIVTTPDKPPVAPPPDGPPSVTPPDGPPAGPPDQPPIANPPGLLPPIVPIAPPDLPTEPGPGGPDGGGPGAGPGGGPPTLSGVPEPALWLQLIAGFSLLGAAIRRRRGQPLTALRARSSA